VTFGPEGFDAHARLRVIPEPEHEGQHEDDVAPLTSLSEIEQVRIAVSLLGAHTRAPGRSTARRSSGRPTRPGASPSMSTRIGQGWAALLRRSRRCWPSRASTSWSQIRW
jgi:hypothetical protein